MLSSSQLLELFVVLCEAHSLRYVFTKVKSVSADAQSKSGPVRVDTLPAPPIHILLTVAQAILSFLIPVIYSCAVVVSGLEQPAWMNALALPEAMWKNATRVLVCVLNISMKRIASSVFDHLSDQYHPIGRREKTRIVQTGPYALVRHPLYTLAFLQPILWSLEFWSYVPLVTMIATVVVFTNKIYIEEEAIQRDEAVGEEYRAYMRKVPARLVPYVW